MLENVLSALKGVAEQNGRGRAVAGRPVEPFQQPSDIDGRKDLEVDVGKGVENLHESTKKASPEEPVRAACWSCQGGFLPSAGCEG